MKKYQKRQARYKEKSNRIKFAYVSTPQGKPYIKSQIKKSKIKEFISKCIKKIKRK